MIVLMGKFLTALFGGTQPATPDADTIAAERYWFANPFGFECRVTLEEPRERQAFVGAESGSLFGALPVPFHGSFHDWGTFQVQGDRFVFLGQHSTRILLFSEIMHTHHGADGVQFHHAGGVMTFWGPVVPAALGALCQTGYLPPAVFRP
jgi:hypothetical protein